MEATPFKITYSSSQYRYPIRVVSRLKKKETNKYIYFCLLHTASLVSDAEQLFVKISSSGSESEKFNL